MESDEKDKRIKKLEDVIEWVTNTDSLEVEQNYEFHKEEFPELHQ